MRQLAWASRGLPEEGKIVVYQHRLTYRFGGMELSNAMYSLSTPLEVEASEVASVKVFNLERTTYDTGITKLILSDTIWMNEPPVDSAHVVVGMCEYQINFHEQNQEVNDLLGKIRHLGAKINRLEEKEEWENYNETMDPLYQQLKGWLRELEYARVVVITFCSC